MSRKTFSTHAVLLIRYTRLLGALKILHERSIEMSCITFEGVMPVIEVLDCPGIGRLWGVETAGIRHDGLHRIIRKQVLIQGCKIQWSEQANPTHHQ